MDRINDARSRLARLSSTTLYGGVLLLTLGTLALGGQRLWSDIEALQTQLAGELQTRAVLLSNSATLMRSTAESARAAVREIHRPAGDGQRYRTCSAQSALDPELLNRHLRLDGPVPASGPTSCMLTLIRDLHRNSVSSGLHGITIIGQGWLLAFPEPRPSLWSQMSGFDVGVKSLIDRAGKGGSANGQFYGPFSAMFLPDATVVGFAAGGKLDTAPEAAGEVNVAVYLNVVTLWEQTLPMNGPPNTVALFSPSGRPIVSGEQLPEQPAVRPNWLSEAAAPSLQTLSGRFEWFGERLVGAATVPDARWILTVAITRTDLITWLIDRNLSLLSGLGMLISLLIVGAVLAMRFIVRPARRVAAMLEQTMDSLQLTFANMSEGLGLLSRDGRILAVNDRFGRLAGLPPSVLEPGGTLDHVRQWLLQTAPERAGQPTHDIARLNAILDSHDDHYSFDSKTDDAHWLEVRFSRIQPSGTIVTVISDITRRKQDEMAVHAAKVAAEEALQRLEGAMTQLVESEKMAALGNLVAGVAHEVNTPIGVGVTASTTLVEAIQTLRLSFQTQTMTKASLESFMERAEMLGELLHENLYRATMLIRSFKQVAVDSHLEEPQPLPLRHYLENALLSLGHELKRGQHAVQLDIDEALILNVVPTQLWQVVSNLILNAVTHAFPDRTGGAISIRASRDSGRFVLEVADDGVGMPSDVARRCFEPFFTTRRGLGGSGLGLSVVHSTVTAGMKGTISVQSRQGVGTLFRIELPLIPDGEPGLSVATPGMAADRAAGSGGSTGGGNI
jgi:signal transduction histidine kinase